MGKQLTVQDLHDMLGVMLGEGIDPDTPIVTSEFIYDTDEICHKTISSIEKEDVIYYDFRLNDEIVKEAIVLE